MILYILINDSGELREAVRGTGGGIFSWTILK
jgi:hypothetical protein